jgi:hypothetical protein
MRSGKKLITRIIVIFGLVATLISSTNAMAAPSSRVGGERGYFNNVTNEALDLSKSFPGIPTLKPLDERINTYDLGLTKPGVNFHADRNPAQGFSATSRLLGYNYDPTIGGQGSGPQLACKSIDDATCKDLNHLALFAVLPPCESAEQSDCISRVSVLNSQGKLEDASPVSKVQNVNFGKYDLVAGEFSADARHNQPAGGSAYVWTFPTYKHRGGALFSPQVMLMNYGEARNMKDLKSFKFNPEFKIGLFPVTVSTEAANPAFSFLQSGYSLVQDTFLDESNFTIEFRSTAPWVSWVRSTVTNLTVNDSESKKDFIYSISGSPARVPGYIKNIPWASNNVESLYKTTYGGDWNVGQWCELLMKNGSAKSLADCRIEFEVNPAKGNFEWAFAQFDAAAPFTDGKATFAPYRWIVENVPAYKLSIQQGVLGSLKGLDCVLKYSGKRPAGITSTNATIATDGPPTWDASTSSLQYRVAALPLFPDGQTFFGQYTLNVPREVAECLWGKSASAAKATIEVLDSNGTKQVVTASLLTSPNWFKFQVSGFHFSSPTIRIKLATTAASTPSPTPTNSATPKKPVIKKIVCTKGKTVKTFLNTAKCPAGYKLKN